MVIHILIVRNRLSVVPSSRPKLTMALDAQSAVTLRPTICKSPAGEPNGRVDRSCLCMLMKRSDPMPCHAMPCHMATWASVWTTNRSRQTAPSTASKQQLDPSNSSKLQWIIRVPVRHIGHRLGPSSACLGRREKERKKKKRASSSAMTSASGRDYPQSRRLAVISPGVIGRLWVCGWPGTMQLWEGALCRRLSDPTTRVANAWLPQTHVAGSTSATSRLEPCWILLLAPHPRFLFPTPKWH